MNDGAEATRPDEKKETGGPVASPQAGASDPTPEQTGCNGLDTPERVRFYEHDFYPLSNFSAFSLMWRGCRFDTSEAAYHSDKFDFDDSPWLYEIAMKIRAAPSAHEAFKIAERERKHRRPDWDEIKVDTMRRILRAKAEQHEYVRRKLLATGDRELVEDSWRDDFWGWGPNRDGKNMLGKLWMEVRAELRLAPPQAATALTSPSTSPDSDVHAAGLPLGHRAPEASDTAGADAPSKGEQ